MSPNETFSVEFPEDTQVLLLLRRWNRELFAKWLGDGLTVLPEADEVPEAFDICILDPTAFADHRETLARLKHEAAPEFLPYLLVVREGNRSYVDEDIQGLVDEIIVIPAAPAEFAIRLRSLLRARHQSLQLGEQKAREIENLAKQNEQLEQFASIVSHDLRNPLSVISGAIGLAEQTEDLDHLELAKNGVQRMEELIDGLLALARQGQSIGETTTVDIAGVAKRAWSVVDAQDAKLVVVDGLTVEADGARLQALFENLLRNSVEHSSTRTDEGYAVTITVGPLGEDRGGFFVADDGPGIPEADHDQVMDDGFTTNPGGTGLGLSIVQSIVDAHGWTVAVAESASGGARFDFECAQDADTSVTEPVPE